MKTFYKLSNESVELMEKLNQALDTLAELHVLSDDVTDLLSRDYMQLFALFQEWHDMEFCDVDVIRILGDKNEFELISIDLLELESRGLIIETYNDND